MDNILVLLLLGFGIGTLGTLIGAGGGFILVPVLLLTRPDLDPELVTAISMAVVACNAISGTVAYVRSKRVDFKAGILFALFTIPGSILGVYSTKYIPRQSFNVIFGVVLVLLAIMLYLRGGKKVTGGAATFREGWTRRLITDRRGETYEYAYDLKKGLLISLIVGYISPLLGIGGGIIHVPAMVQWLHFPVHIATATSHFVLAIMATVSVVVHAVNGNYNDPAVLRMVIALAAGVIGGAQLGAYLSRHLKDKFIVKALAVSMGLVGIRILIQAL